jgi:hypothetical protein
VADSGTGEWDDDVRNVARAFARSGHTAAWLREFDEAKDRGKPFWVDVAAELDALEARARLRVIRSPGVIRPRRTGYRL